MLRNKLKKLIDILPNKNNAKTTLLKEIHHRVKNNLQVINSLLKLQGNEMFDDKAYAVFEECQNRVISMALIHEKLYQSENLSHVNAKVYFTVLINDLIETYNLSQKVTANINITVEQFGTKTLVPLGLIVNELISNSLKHGFSIRNERGYLLFDLSVTDDNGYKLRIGDDNPKFHEQFLDNTNSLGLELVTIFVEQLDGEIKQLGNSAIFEIHFRSID